MRINLREMLGRLDLETDNIYDLRNHYDSSKLSDLTKNRLAEALNEKASAEKINRILNENFAINVFPRGSEEYFKLDKVASWMTNLSPNGIYYRVEKTYFDYGQNWMYTTIIAYNKKGDSWQALYPKQQEEILLCQTDDEIEEVAKKILRESRLDKGFTESLSEDLDLSEVEEIKELPFDNKRVNNLRGIFSTKALVDALNKVGLDKFKIRTSRLKNVSQGDIKDAWMDLKRKGWSVSIERDDSLNGFNEVYVFEKTTNESLTEASYGGAYDIEDDMYFTKEELVEFADEFIEKFSDWSEHRCDLEDLYMDRPKHLVVDVYDNDDGVTHRAEVDIDMRKIRTPKFIYKYGDSLLKQWKDSYLEYHEYDESLTEEAEKEQLYKIVCKSGASEWPFESALSYEDAEEMVEYYGGRWIDERGFEWSMEIEEDDESTERVYPFNESLKEGFEDYLYRHGVQPEDIQDDQDYDVYWNKFYNDLELEREKEEDLEESIDISDYEELHYPLRDGDKYYQLYRKIENGKGVWAAAELDKYGSEVVGEPFKITYEQARGFEPIEDSSIRKLSRDLGKKLLPKRENLNEDYRPLAIGYMILKKEIPNHVNYAEFANYDEVVTAIPSEAVVVVYPRGGKIGGTDIAYWQFDAIDSEGKKTKANFSTYIYSLKDFLNNDEMEFRLIHDFKLIDEYPYLIEVDDNIEESLNEAYKFIDSKKLEKNYPYYFHYESNNPFAAEDFWRYAESLNCLKVEGRYKDSQNVIFFVCPSEESYNKLLQFNKKNSLLPWIGELSNNYSNDYDQLVVKFLGKPKKLENLKEAIEDEIDFDEEEYDDFDDDAVEEGTNFIEDGTEWVWVERIAGPIHLDFDNWAVWSAREYVDPRDFMTIHDNGKGYDFDAEGFKKKAMAAPVNYFVVDEDTGFIDWGPVESQTEAQDFLNGKVEDWEKDESLNESEELKEDYWYTLHYEDIGGGREYDYEVTYDELFDCLLELAFEEDDAPEDTKDYMDWVENNFDSLYSKYKDDILDYFEEDASQKEYDERDPDDKYDSYADRGVSTHDFY